MQEVISAPRACGDDPDREIEVGKGAVPLFRVATPSLTGIIHTVGLMARLRSVLPAHTGMIPDVIESVYNRFVEKAK